MKLEIDKICKTCDVTIGKKGSVISDCLIKNGVNLKSRAAFLDNYKSWVKENGDVLEAYKCRSSYKLMIAACYRLTVITDKNDVITDWRTGYFLDGP